LLTAARVPGTGGKSRRGNVASERRLPASTDNITVPGRPPLREGIRIDTIYGGNFAGQGLK
jgi:hypothetical protein